MTNATYKREVAAVLKNNIKPSHKKKPTPTAKKRVIGQDSQREHVNPKTGKVTKKPSPRLMARRKKDTVPGYYPNPIGISPSLRAEIGNAQVKAIATKNQAFVSYWQGLMRACVDMGYITPEQYADKLHEMRVALNK